MKHVYRKYSRNSEPIGNSLQDFDVTHKRIIKPWGIDDDDAIVMEAWEFITWVDNHWFEIGSH